MNIRSFKVRSLLIAILLFVCASICLAQDNIISSVTISKSKLDKKGYELNIDSTQPVQYKSYIDGDENIYFDLKNSVLAPNMGTIYDDVADIDNLTVKQYAKNRVRIYINGKNAKNTELVFVNSLFEVNQIGANKVTINRPINEYKTTSYYNRDLEDVEDIQAWDDNSFNLTHLSNTLFAELKDGFAGKVSIIVLVLTLIILILRSVSSKLAQEKEPLIGLNNAAKKYPHKSVELGTSRIVSNKIVPNDVPLKNVQANQVLNILQNSSSNNQRSRALAQAQEELTKAHSKYQQYLQNKYSGVKNSPSYDVDAIKKSIALNQYQKSTQNPYSNQEVIRIKKDENRDFTSNLRQDDKTFSGLIPPKKEFSSPYIQRKTNLVSNENIEQKTNSKFLDSVTKIYERSGRGDLADGLKKSINKPKQTI